MVVAVDLVARRGGTGVRPLSATLAAGLRSLVVAGATIVREESYGEHLGHVVMLDPDGNEFCVA